MELNFGVRTTGSALISIRGEQSAPHSALGEIAYLERKLLKGDLASVFDILRGSRHTTSSKVDRHLINIRLREVFLNIDVWLMLKYLEKSTAAKKIKRLYCLDVSSDLKQLHFEPVFAMGINSPGYLAYRIPDTAHNRGIAQGIARAIAVSLADAGVCDLNALQK